MIEIGSTVSVRGEKYKLLSRKHAGDSGPRFFGKYTFILVNGSGQKFKAFGKTVTGNSKITPMD